MKTCRSIFTVLSFLLISSVMGQTTEQYKNWETAHFKAIVEFEEKNQQALSEGTEAVMQEYEKKLLAAIAKDSKNPLLLKRAGDLMAFRQNQAMVSKEEIIYYVSMSKNPSPEVKEVLDVLLKKFEKLQAISVEAERYYQSGAEQNESESIIALVEFYRNGYFRFQFNLPLIIYQVNNKSISYLRRAMELENEYAALLLAEIYALGEDEISSDMAMVDRVVKETRDPAMSYLMLGGHFLDTERSYPKESQIYQALRNAEILLLKSSELGNKDAAYYLGLIYSGKYDLPEFKQKDEDKAFLYFKKSVIDEKQTPAAYYSLANCYIDGMGTARNLKAGITMLEKLLNSNVEGMDRDSLKEEIENAKKQL